MLVAAFRATLEEVIEADVILHVRDVSHEDTEAQSHDVEEVLGALGIDPNDEQRLIEVWNKIDRLDADGRARLQNLAERRPARQAAGAGVGADRGGRRWPDQGDRGAARACAAWCSIWSLDPADGAGVSWLHRHTEVMEQIARRGGQAGHDGAGRSGQGRRGAGEVPDALNDAAGRREEPAMTLGSALAAGRSGQPPARRSRPRPRRCASAKSPRPCAARRRSICISPSRRASSPARTSSSNAFRSRAAPTRWSRRWRPAPSTSRRPPRPT